MSRRRRSGTRFFKRPGFGPSVAPTLTAWDFLAGNIERRTREQLEERKGKVEEWAAAAFSRGDGPLNAVLTAELERIAGQLARIGAPSTGETGE